MKKDQYIPHEVSMRNTSEVMNLIEKEGMAGYGIYWALMEYLRTQDDYKGDVRVLKSLARSRISAHNRIACPRRRTAPNKQKPAADDPATGAWKEPAVVHLYP